MGRKRKTENAGVPPYVYPSKGWWVLREYDPVSKKLIGSGIPLCREGVERSEIWAAWEHATKTDTGTFDALATRYFKSPSFIELAKVTQQHYRDSSRRISSTKITAGGLFGQLKIPQITPVVIQRYMDFRANAKVTANRERSFMLKLFGWGHARGYCDSNPVIPVERYKETPRDLYVTDEMYQAVYDLADEAEFYIRPAMELAYLLRARTIELVDLRTTDLIKKKGVRVRRVKGSKTNIIKWSPRLRAAVHAASPLQSKVKSLFVLSNTLGQPLTESGFQTAWQRLMVKAASKGIQRFHFHDLKAKGYSDDENDKQGGAGHKTDLSRVYQRGEEEFDSVR